MCCMPMSYAYIRVPKHIEFLEMLASENNHVGIFISLLLLIYMQIHARAKDEELTQ